MHAILLSVGTDGDVIPFLGLGARLRERGHRVTLAANEHFRDAALGQGLQFEPLISDESYRTLLENPDMWHPTRSALLGIKWGKPLIRPQYELIARLAAEPNSVLIANPGILAARIAQEKLGCPLASIVLQPWLIPSAIDPPTMPGKYHLPRWAPRPFKALHLRSMNALGDVLIGGYVNRVRSELGLPRMRSIFRWWMSPQCMLGLFPHWYAPPPADWPAQLRLAGFPMFDGRPAAPLDPDVLAFCRAAEPPIAFTMGTGMLHAAAFFREAIEACRLLNRRGLLLTQFPQQLPPTLPPNVRHCPHAPFLHLFPHCGVAAHHGGIGTLAKALATGTPQLALPLAWDQMDNARRLRDLGVGEWLAPRRRRARDLAAALARLLSIEAQARAKSIAVRHAGEADALDRAANWIEELAPGTNPASRASE